MTLTQLEYIVAVEKHRHFGKAAEACHVAQPSLSAQILKLEEELGVKIFERSKTACVLTEVGQDIVRQARLILDEARRIDDIVTSYRTEIKGTLKLGLIPTIAPFLLPTILPPLRKVHPGLKLELFEQKTTDLVALIEKGEIDAAILSTPKTAPETLLEKVLYFEPFVLFSSKGHPLRKIPRISVDELEKHSPLLLDDTHCMRDQVEKLCQSGNRAESPVQIKSGTIQTLVEVVSSSGGYTLLPALAQDLFRKSHPDYFREFEDPKPSRKVSLVFHRSFLKRPLIEAVAKLVEGHLPKGLIPVGSRSKTRIIDPRVDRFDS